MPKLRELLVDGWREPVMEVRAGDTSPIAFTLLEDGAAFDLTGATAGKIFWMNVNYWTGRDWYGPPSLADLWDRRTESDDEGEDVTITADATGIVTLAPTATMFDRPADYYLMISLTKGGYEYRWPTKPESQIVRVHASLAGSDGVEP